MIYRIDKKRADKRLLSSYKSTTARVEQTVLDGDYTQAIVKKPWGYEYLLFENKFVSIWILQIIRKRKTSVHCHPKKRTALLLLSGDAVFHHLGEKIKLFPMDVVIIGEGTFHSTEAFSSLSMKPQSESGIWIMEIESPSLKTDLVRLKDEYGRAGTCYEGMDQMVFESQKCLKFREPRANEIIRRSFFDCSFTIRKGHFSKDKTLPSQEALVSIIGKDSITGPDSSSLNIGDIVIFKDIHGKIKDKELDNYTILTIEKSQKLAKISDYIFSLIENLGVKRVFAVCGGTAMHLVDSLGRNKNIDYVAMHHEQAAAMAAEGYSRISNNIGVALVSSGPGATNAITGVCGAWIDSIPAMFISGQVTSDTLTGNRGFRQFGLQETDIVRIVKSITKYAVTVTDPTLIKFHFQKAIYLATTGRPGPVWLDIPLDVQSKLINPERLLPFIPPEQKRKGENRLLKKQVAKCIKMLKKAKRPVMISGYGIRLAKAENEFLNLFEKLKIPMVSSWTSSDLILTKHKLYVGRSGIMGDRASNFAVQNSDLLLIIGSRMSIPQVGYNFMTFAREAKKIMVDVDKIEFKKPSLTPDLPVKADAKEFITEMLAQLEEGKVVLDVGEWAKRCQEWKLKYPVTMPEYKKTKGVVNSFYFIDVLSQKLTKDAVVVTDVGTSLTSTMQAFKTKVGQRLFSSCGHSSMGFGLPGSIGACFANGKKKTICISGDGGLHTNIQELQTLIHNKLPVILFILSDGGYLTVKLMQQNHFGRYVGSEKSSGLSFPDIVKVARAYGIKAERITTHNELHARIDAVLSEPGPFVCEIIMSEIQPLVPRVSSIKTPDGAIVARPLEDLYPFLDREEFLKNMIVNPVEVLK